jgi:hypothetical protein
VPIIDASDQASAMVEIDSTLPAFVMTLDATVITDTAAAHVYDCDCDISTNGGVAFVFVFVDTRDGSWTGTTTPDKKPTELMQTIDLYFNFHTTETQVKRFVDNSSLSSKVSK